MNITDQLAQALEHMQVCQNCAEDDWTSCDGGRRALEALKAYRASKEGESYRALIWDVDQFQEGDEFQLDGEWKPAPRKNYGLTYCGAYLPHRRPIRAT